MIAIICSRKNIIRIKHCRNEDHFQKMMNDPRIKWGHLVHKESGMLVTQIFNSAD